eukprot:5293852-Amphidinium_carterae.1
MEFQLDLVSQGYMGQKSCETGERTDPLKIAVEYQKQRDKQLPRWSTALMRQEKQADVDKGRLTADNLQGNQQADVLANQGIIIAQHGPLEPDATWLNCADFADKVCHFFWRQVGPQLRERPEDKPRARLLATAGNCSQRASHSSRAGF